MSVTAKRTQGWLEVSLSTRATPEQVYDYLSELSRHGEWAGTLGTVSQTSDGPVATGTTYRAQERMRESGKAGDVTSAEITALERPKRIAWNARTETAKGPMAMRSRWEFVIEPDGSGSRVTQRMRFAPPNPLSRVMLTAFLPIANLVGGMGASSKMVKKNVEHLQEKLDALG